MIESLCSPAAIAEYIRMSVMRKELHNGHPQHSQRQRSEARLGRMSYEHNALQAPSDCTGACEIPSSTIATSLHARQPFSLALQAPAPIFAEGKHLTGAWPPKVWRASEECIWWLLHSSPSPATAAQPLHYHQGMSTSIPGAFPVTLSDDHGASYDAPPKRSSSGKQVLTSFSKRRRPAMHQKRTTIRDSDDYLTARFANPMTGLVSPSIYSLCSNGALTPRTPRTPGEALAQFYGDGIYLPSIKKGIVDGTEGLNQYFDLGKKTKRPVLRRTSGEEAVHSRLNTRNVPSLQSSENGCRKASISSEVEKLSSTGCGAQDPMRPASSSDVTNIERVASFWSKARRRFQQPVIEGGVPLITVTGAENDLSTLPPIHLIHPSRAATPRAERLKKPPQAPSQSSSASAVGSSTKASPDSNSSSGLFAWSRKSRKPGAQDAPIRPSETVVLCDAKVGMTLAKKFGWFIRYSLLVFYAGVFTLQGAWLMQYLIKVALLLVVFCSRLVFLVSGIQ